MHNRTFGNILENISVIFGTKMKKSTKRVANKKSGIEWCSSIFGVVDVLTKGLCCKGWTLTLEGLNIDTDPKKKILKLSPVSSNKPMSNKRIGKKGR